MSVFGDDMSLFCFTECHLRRSVLKRIISMNFQKNLEDINKISNIHEKHQAFSLKNDKDL